MRSFFAKIFLCTLVIYPVARGLGLLALFAVGADTRPPPPPFLDQALQLYARAAVATLEHEGPDALRRFVAQAEAAAGLELALQPVPASGCTGAGPPGAPPGQVGPPFPHHPPPAAIRVRSEAGVEYCLTARPQPSAHHPPPPPWDILVPPMELLCCAVVSFFLARYLTTPIREIRAAAAAFAQGQLSARVGARIGRRRDEAADLAREFDHMADRVSALIETQRRFIGDVSHEIKSPLARLSMALGLARREVGEAASAQFDRMEREIDEVSRMVRELLALSSLQEDVRLDRAEPLELSVLVATAIDDVAFEWPARAGLIRLAGPDQPVLVLGDEALLKRAIENVLRNALFYTPDGTAVEVAVTAAGAEARLSIRDHGPGVPAEALTHLFEPFYRVDEARARNTGGLGIGLAICERAVALHGGRITASNAAPRGLLVQISLPQAGTAARAAASPPAGTAARAGAAFIRS